MLIAIRSPERDGFTDAYLCESLSEWKRIADGAPATAKAAVADAVRIEVHGMVAKWLEDRESLLPSPFGKFVASGGSVEQLLGLEIIGQDWRMPV